MSLPSPATKTYLDNAADDPKQARGELATLVDTVNALITHLGLSGITSTPTAIGEGLEDDGSGNLRVKLNGSTLSRGASGLSVNIANVVPAGVVAAYAGSAAPSGWLLCDGSNVSRTTYSALFSAIGTTYGAGDGSTTFALPDLRGRAVFGKDNMGASSANRVTSGGSGITGSTLGATGGAETVTLTVAQLPANTVGSGNYDPAGTGGLFTKVSTVDGSGNATGGSGNAHNNMPPSLILNYIIRT